MSRLKTTAIEAALDGFCERLDRFIEKAADKAEGDMHKYLEYLLN